MRSGGWELVWICLIGFFDCIKVTVEDMYGKDDMFLEFSFSSACFSMCLYLCMMFSLLKASPWPAHKSASKLWVTICCFLSSPADSAEWRKESPQHNSSPQSSLSSSLCVTGELFFTVCEMTHFFFTKPNKRPHHNAPASSSDPHSSGSHISPR